ncbi:hypothetical protein PISMIDRAFT_166003 [Pisolithus microcarpus 441]|uniref:Uncharacterized protein n=1 Tax=Pisolithus microcarpus 441 TaxID=765257 RepID=A0A0D0A6K8_9AGAM|nr:hypothetical protein PISMIDRAFT_166003 [Pisolithus microcarpus 441]
MGVVCHLRELMRPTMGRVPVCVPVCSPHAALTLSAKYHLLFVCFFVIPILCLLMVVVPPSPQNGGTPFLGGKHFSDVSSVRCSLPLISAYLDDQYLGTARSHTCA